MHFFSLDTNKDADFALPIKDSFDETADACYLVRPNKFYGKSTDFVYSYHFSTHLNSVKSIIMFCVVISQNLTSKDDEKEANMALEKKRSILPKVYSEAKKQRARRINALAEPEIEEEIMDPEIEGKAELRSLIQQKMHTMDAIFMDLTTDDIQNIQDVLDESDDELNNDPRPDGCKHQ